MLTRRTLSALTQSALQRQLRKVDDAIMIQVSYVFISSVVSKTEDISPENVQLKTYFPLVSLVRPFLVRVWLHKTILPALQWF